MKSKFLSLILVLALLATSAACVYASNGGTKGNGNKAAVTTTTTDQGDSTEKVKADNGKNDSDAAVKATKKESIIQKKAQIRSEYTAEKLNAVSDASEKIKKEDPNTKVLGFDSIISDNAKFKFDTPPVIKGGRTLIPVRAITEGFGAELTFNKESQVVTITKGDTVIELTLGSTVAVVNGKEVQMDTKANIVNNRTYVPLRFVLEAFKLSVDWDQDTETVEISDGTTGGTTDVPEGTTTDTTETASPGAVTVSE